MELGDKAGDVIEPIANRVCVGVLAPGDGLVDDFELVFEAVDFGDEGMDPVVDVGVAAGLCHGQSGRPDWMLLVQTSAVTALVAFEVSGSSGARGD